METEDTEALSGAGIA